MGRIIAGSGHAALIALAACLAVAARAAADAPDVPSVALVATVAQPTATADAPSPAVAAPRARDRLLELVAEYLEVAFARDAHDNRTAQLEPPQVAAAQ